MVTTMNTKLVYRIEDQAGLGPYRGVHDKCFTPESHNRNTERHPSPYEDGLAPYEARQEWGDEDGNLPRCVFGFNDINQLEEWFDRESREYIQSFGRGLDREYVVSIYSVPQDRMAYGKKQVLFSHEDAVRVARLDLVALVDPDMSL